MIGKGAALRLIPQFDQRIKKALRIADSRQRQHILWPCGQRQLLGAQALTRLEVDPSLWCQVTVGDRRGTNGQLLFA